MTIRHEIYLDNHATTPLDPRVLDAMLPFMTEHFGNAASNKHAFGYRAKTATDEARATIAGVIGAYPDEIVFTSGATESNNLAIKGIMDALPGTNHHIISVVTEHKSVLDTCKYLETNNCITYLPVDASGLIDLDHLEQAISATTVLVSVMAANNEIGVLQPLHAIGDICKRHNVLFHTDAAQAFGKIPLNVNQQHIDLMSLSAHKMYGPKGIGALYVRRGTALASQILGGGHEGGRRSGTLNVPAIVGFSAATQLTNDMQAETDRIFALRTQLHQGILRGLDGVRLNGHPMQRLAGNLNLSFEGVDGDSLLLEMNDIAVSTGSACNSASARPSYVLSAIGLHDELARSSIRFGLGRFTTSSEIEITIDRVVTSVRRLRSMYPSFHIPCGL